MSVQNNLETAMCNELTKILVNKIHKVRAKGLSTFNDKGNYGGRVTTKIQNGKKMLQVSFWGQAMWTTEFGKGLGIGLTGPGDPIFNSDGTEVTANNYYRQVFKGSKIWKQYNKIRNSDRDSKKYSYMDTGKTKKATVSYLRNGKTVSYERDKKVYKLKFDAAREFRIYSRPDGYIDIDGIPRSSEARAVFAIESPTRIGKKKMEKVSHYGARVIEKEFNYSFVKQKTKGDLLTEQEKKQFTNTICEEIVKYINDTCKGK